MTLHPPYLSQGDAIGLVAPARFINPEKITLAEKIFNEWGLVIHKGKNLFGKHFQFSGIEKERYQDLQDMFDRPNIKAIICAGGGYGSVQIFSDINFQIFNKHPKWLVGFSDITILHSALNVQTGYETIHGTMPVMFDVTPASITSLETLKKALFGQLEKYRIATSNKNIMGRSTGVLIGGNLSILTSLLGTPFDLDYQDKILFIEEVDEYLYHIERMMYSLKLAGKLKQINGLIVGNLSKVHDNEIPFGKDEKQIISDLVSEYGYPVVFDFPAGHEDLNYALYLGKKVVLEVRDQESILRF